MKDNTAKFPVRLRTVFTYDAKSEPPSIVLSQMEEGKEAMSGRVILTEDVFVQILDEVSQMRPDLARECARVYWRASKRKKREPFSALDECRIDHVKPQPNQENGEGGNGSTGATKE